MKHKFIAEKTKEFKIIRDYHVSNDHLQGIKFVLHDIENKRIFSRFLRNELIHNNATWERKSLFDSTRFCMVIEEGDFNKVVHEKGVLSISKNGSEAKQYNAEKITFYLRARR